jgi:integrase
LSVVNRKKSRFPHQVPPMRPTTHIYLSAAEVAALANVCGDQGDVVLILAYTGLRFGELIGLNVEDVDLDARRVRVRRSMTQVGGRLVEGNPKSMAGRCLRACGHRPRRRALPDSPDISGFVGNSCAE